MRLVATDWFGGLQGRISVPGLLCQADRPAPVRLRVIDDAGTRLALARLALYDYSGHQRD